MVELKGLTDHGRFVDQLPSSIAIFYQYENGCESEFFSFEDNFGTCRISTDCYSLYFHFSFVPAEFFGPYFLKVGVLVQYRDLITTKKPVRDEEIVVVEEFCEFCCIVFVPGIGKGGYGTGYVHHIG